MQIRDRIKEFKRVPASRLRPNPKNWRLHPVEQHDALRGILAEVGIAGAVLVRELDDGFYQLIDGHLRVETLGDQDVPVLVLDVTAEEADKILLTHDTITGLAELDDAKFRELIAGTEIESQAILDMLEEMTTEEEAADSDEQGRAEKEPTIPEIYQIKITCRDVKHQEELFNRFTDEGLDCALMNL